MPTLKERLLRARQRKKDAESSTSASASASASASISSSASASGCYSPGNSCSAASDGAPADPAIRVSVVVKADHRGLSTAGKLLRRITSSRPGTGSRPRSGPGLCPGPGLGLCLGPGPDPGPGSKSPKVGSGSGDKAKPAPTVNNMGDKVGNKAKETDEVEESAGSRNSTADEPRCRNRRRPMPTLLCYFLLCWPTPHRDSDGDGDSECDGDGNGEEAATTGGCLGKVVERRRKSEAEAESEGEGKGECERESAAQLECLYSVRQLQTSMPGVNNGFNARVEESGEEGEGDAAIGVGDGDGKEQMTAAQIERLYRTAASEVAVDDFEVCPTLQQKSITGSSNNDAASGKATVERLIAAEHLEEFLQRRRRRRDASPSKAAEKLEEEICLPKTDDDAAAAAEAAEAADAPGSSQDAINSGDHDRAIDEPDRLPAIPTLAAESQTLEAPSPQPPTPAHPPTPSSSSAEVKVDPNDVSEAAACPTLFGAQPEPGQGRLLFAELRPVTPDGNESSSEEPAIPGSAGCMLMATLTRLTPLHGSPSRVIE